MKPITIVGSYNVGLFLKGERLPHVGETVIADTFHEGGGGKGSNQAVAASIFGAQVQFVAKIGDDGLPGDNVRSVALGAAHRLRVLLVDGDPRESRHDDELFYLEAALRALSGGGCVSRCKWWRPGIYSRSPWMPRTSWRCATWAPWSVGW